MTQAKPQLKKIRIGDLLVQHEIIDASQLEKALAIQKASGNKLGKVLIDSGALTEVQLLNFLAQQLNIDYVDLGKFDINPELMELIPEVQARRFRVIALEEKGDGIVIGMADPTDIIAYDEVSRLLKRPLDIAVVSESALLKTFESVYRRTLDINGYVAELGEQVASSEKKKDKVTAVVQTDAPVAKLLQTMFEDALQVNASDIHIEPEEDELRIRFRIDGVLRVQTVAQNRIANPLLSRLKLMAGLDISEKRLPQDGRFNVKVREQNIDVRLSTLPLQYGESAVMRLLNQSEGLKVMEQLGMPDQLLKRFRRLTKSPHGIVLVVGPTGSGKTTTLYSILRELNDPGVKIITVEDPVEYRLPGITQVQVNPKIDLTFAKVLRSVLRQDPDIALVGEMRDRETMEIGLRAAMTGHFVLSTLHTNDAVSTIMRLIDMGAEPYLIAASVRGILAQRLVRKVCENCAQPDELDSVQQAMIAEAVGEDVDHSNFMRGKGCGFCSNTGYHGRIGIYEFLEFNGELVQTLHQCDVMKFTRIAPLQKGFRSLKLSALDLVMQGKTTIDELLRVSLGAE